jgi:AraC family transcriptional regulator, regulatory protein of adaptative response / DNA-3-methyladenine glycosylase II
MTNVESLQTAQESTALDATRADACYLALKARDARFDGRFFTGVTSTKIYCRPVCKVRAPKKENCRFFDHAAQAESAGFRPCLRCRPELAPQMLHWSTQDASAMLSQQAARLLDDPESWPPRSPTACGSLPPEGANLATPLFENPRGGPSGNCWPPRSPTACGSLPPEGANFPRGGPSGNCTPPTPEGAWRENSGLRASGGEGSRIDQLSQRLGISDRHLRRIFEAQFGVSPLQYLQTRRLLTAKQLLTDTNLPVTQIALSSGFASVRRFNAAFVGHYKLNPTALRRAGSSRAMGPAGSVGAAQSATVRLGYRPPYDVAAMLAFLQKRAIGGVTVVTQAAAPGRARTIRTTLNLGNAGGVNCFNGVKGGVGNDGSDGSFGLVAEGAGGIGGIGGIRAGWLTASFDEANSQVLLTVSDSLLDALPLVIRRVRHWLDLDADPAAIHEVMHSRFPNGEGLRVPGCLDGFELAVRAVLGQQITVAAACTLAQRLVDKFGVPTKTPFADLTRLFPSANALAGASGDALGSLGIVKQRQAAIVAIAQAVASGRIVLHAGAEVPATMAALKALPGIGDWTAHYIAMRALRWPDAFPAGDVALHKALGVLGSKSAAKDVEAMSEDWKPWRSYAVVRAWATL